MRQGGKQRREEKVPGSTKEGQKVSCWCSQFLWFSIITGELRKLKCSEGQIIICQID